MRKEILFGEVHGRGRRGQRKWQGQVEERQEGERGQGRAKKGQKRSSEEPGKKGYD